MNHIPGGAAIVGANGAGTPRPAARPIPVPGAALDPRSLDLDCKTQVIMSQTSVFFLLSK